MKLYYHMTHFMLCLYMNSQTYHIVYIQISKDLFISILTQKHIHSKSFHTIELQTKAKTEYI